jgi:hypothetical protein
MPLPRFTLPLNLPNVDDAAARILEAVRPDLVPQQLNADVRHRIDAHSTEAGFLERALTNPRALSGVAEGDSWFDYLPSYLENPLRGDLIGHLNTGGRVNVFKVAKAGDTLENMIFGTEVDGHFRPEPAQIDKTLEVIRRRQPRFFLFSGGGNDIAGVELEAYLNHQGRDGHATGLPVLRAEHVEYVFNTVFRNAFEQLIAQVKDAAPDIHIFLHGYANAIPDGRGVVNTPFGWHFVGPWLLPALAHKRIIDPVRQRAIIRELIGHLNTLLADLAARNANVHYIDCRPAVQDADWVNELHLTSAAFGRVATLFENTIVAALGGQ